MFREWQLQTCQPQPSDSYGENTLEDDDIGLSFPTVDLLTSPGHDPVAHSQYQHETPEHAPPHAEGEMNPRKAARTATALSPSAGQSAAWDSQFYLPAVRTSGASPESPAQHQQTGNALSYPSERTCSETIQQLKDWLEPTAVSPGFQAPAVAVEHLANAPASTADSDTDKSDDEGSTGAGTPEPAAAPEPRVTGEVLPGSASSAHVPRATSGDDSDEEAWTKERDDLT